MTPLHAAQRVRISPDAHAYAAGRTGVLRRRLVASGRWVVEFAETVCGRHEFAVVCDDEVAEVVSEGNEGDKG